MIRKSRASELAKLVGVTPAREMEAVIKAQPNTAVLKASKKQNLTHAEFVKRSGLQRFVETEILVKKSNRSWNQNHFCIYRQKWELNLACGN